MPETQLLFFCEEDRSVPVLEWLDELHDRDQRAYNKCLALIDRLAQLGHELRRPTADFLQNRVYELRTRVGNVNYRVLYFLWPKRSGIGPQPDEGTGDSKDRPGDSDLSKATV